MINVRCSMVRVALSHRNSKRQIDTKRTVILSYLIEYCIRPRKCNKIILINKWHKKYLKIIAMRLSIAEIVSKYAVQLNVDIKQLWYAMSHGERESSDSPIMFIFIFLAHICMKSLFIIMPSNCV